MLHISRCCFARETNWDHSQRSISILSKVRGKKRIYNLGWPEEEVIGSNLNTDLREYPIRRIYIKIDSRFSFVHSKNVILTFSHCLIGQVSELSWPRVTEIEIPRYIRFIESDDLTIFWKLHISRFHEGLLLPKFFKIFRKFRRSFRWWYHYMYSFPLEIPFYKPN